MWLPRGDSADLCFGKQWRSIVDKGVVGRDLRLDVLARQAATVRRLFGKSRR